MKKTLVVCFFLSQLIINAQEIKNQLYSCGSDDVNKKIMQNNPELASRMAAYETAVKQGKLTAKGVTSVYKIPVVIHVMHKGEAIGVGTNISDDLIKAKIRAINEQYRKIPGSSGDGAGVDMEIEFVLAVRDPQGNQTSGIVRYDMSSKSSYMNYGIKHYGSNGISEASLKSLSYWNSNIYYNIWTVSEIDGNKGGSSGIHAWATFAPSHGSSMDGAVILSNYFKDPNSTTETHELGHALNLYHTFEGDNNGNSCPPSNPAQGDLCADTAPHKRTVTDCSATTNSCYPDNTDLGYLNNYMNYGFAICQNMFTADQKNRAVTALTTLRSSFLSTTSTNKFIPNAAPIADFFPNQPVILTTNSNLQLSDASTGVPNNYLVNDNWPGITFNWNVTNGTATLTSTEQNPNFHFTSPGFYSISHDVNNGLGSDSKTANQVIHVIAPEPELPAETLSSTSSGNYTVNYVKFGDIEKRTSATTNTAYSDFINTDKTLLIAGNTYTLSLNINSGSAYREYFAVYIDWNGDGIFSETEKLGPLSIGPGNSNPFSGDVPIPTDGVKNRLIRMRVVGNADTGITNDMVNGTAPFFIGDTKDFGLYIIDPQTLGTDQYALNNVNYYPNPVKDVLSITNTDNIEKVEIYNITGQLLLSQNFQDTNIKVDLSQLVKGVYIATVYVNGGKSSIKILKN
ncbi:MAG: M43 family zinc metalloprotease [Flavobacterium sp.]